MHRVFLKTKDSIKQPSKSKTCGFLVAFLKLFNFQHFIVHLFSTILVTNKIKV